MRSQESEEFGQTGSVGMIFNDTQFDAKDFVRLRTLGGSREQEDLLGRVFLPEFLDIVDGIDLLDHIKSLSDQFLLDDLQEFVLLESFTRDIQWKII